ncbi:hypothetical protein Slin15195_G114830 [Septoria linicola]|uniref:Uncharacterized protein n=1 Tax=Septoria linicola TaxID=215465 RepID=A0A9Q9AZP0_9PEZI|nr:hypothetical protein Slin15195_G114830 [Septoria linicola]
MKPQDKQAEEVVAMLAERTALFSVGRMWRTHSLIALSLKQNTDARTSNAKDLDCYFGVYRQGSGDTRDSLIEQLRSGLRYYESTNPYNFNDADPGEDVTLFRNIHQNAISSGQIQNLNVINSRGTNFCALPGKSS